MAIKLKNLSFSYGDTPVLKDFSLTVEKNDRVLISGPSGAGKTTLFRLILGLEKATSGDISVPEKISAVFQEDRLFEGASVIKNLASTGPKEEAERLLALAGLSGVKTKLPAELSGGMKRRVAILRALNFDADALLLDEPFNGLDDDNKKIMADLILEKYGDKPMLLISHNKEDALLLGARIVNLE